MGEGRSNSLHWYCFHHSYAGTVKHHNVCKRYVAIGTGFKQSEHTIFLHVISMGLKLYCMAHYSD